MPLEPQSPPQNGLVVPAAAVSSTYEGPLHGSLPPVPAHVSQQSSCFDTAWELLEAGVLANTIRDRHTALKKKDEIPLPTPEDVASTNELIRNLHPLECRDSIIKFFRWQSTTTPEAPLYYAERLVHNRAPANRTPLSILTEIAESIVASGFVTEKLTRETIHCMHDDIRNRNPISVTPSLLSMGLVAATASTVSPLAAAASGLAAGLFLRAYYRENWARQEYTAGYLQEIFDTHQALSRGETPTIKAALRSHFNWDKNERFRADGYMVARTLRILEVPSAVIHEAFAKTESVERPNQPLVHLLQEKLHEVKMNTSGCLAEDYLASEHSKSDLVLLLDSLNECYFAWGSRSGRRYQMKMIELLTRYA